MQPAGADGVVGTQGETGLRFEYFGAREFGETPVVASVDRDLSGALTSGSFRGLPGPGDRQRWRWTGEIYLPVAGRYEFQATTLSVQQLTIDGTVVVEDMAGSRTSKRGTYVASAGGWVSFKFEVVDLSSSTQGSLEWRTPDDGAMRPLRAREVPGAGPAGIAGSRTVLRYGSTVAVVDGSDDDFHLASASGSYHGGLWQADGTTSPAIDAGDPSIVVRETAPSAGARAGQTGGRINLGFARTISAPR